MPAISAQEDQSRPGNADLAGWCFRQEWPTFVAGLAILLMATTANILTALLFQPLFDNGVLGKQTSVLVSVVALQTALFVARGALAGFAFDLFARASARLGQRLTLRVFDHIQTHSYSYFIDHPQSRLLQLLRNDVLVLEVSIGQTLGQAIVATLQTILALLVIFLWDPRLALLCMIGIVTGATLIWFAARLANRALHDEISANETVAEHLLMMLSLRGALLRVSASPDWGRSRLVQLLDHYRQMLVRRRVLPNWITVAGEGVSTATYFCFYLVGAYLVAGGTATAGSLIAMAALVSYLIGSMNQLAPTYVGLGDAWLRLGRLEKELLIAPSRRETEQSPVSQTLRGAFELKQVTVRYRDAIALNNLSVVIEPGGITAITGSSGAGKTTLTMLLLGLIEPETGQVTVDGDGIGKYGRQTLWKHIGYVPQEPILFRGSARENIAVGRPIAETDIVATNIKTGTHGRLAAANEGYDSDLGESGFRLSGGERQRISLARALAGRPSVLVLDEPTANLDAATETLIRNILVDQRDAGRTVVIVTHNPAILAIADRVILLKQGQLVCSGSARDSSIQARLFEETKLTTS
jgi:ABC-type bacteriocin/lantibiotic exporter with double-glycine peptidase domain